MIEVCLNVKGRPTCRYKVLLPELDDASEEQAAHTQRVLQSAIELGLSLLDAQFKIVGDSALPEDRID